MTITHPIFMWLGVLTPLALNLAFVGVGLLLFRTERKIHIAFLLAGAVLLVLVNIWNLALWAPEVGLYYLNEDSPDWQGLSELFAYQYLVEFGVQFLGTGLLGYGLVTHALIQYRKSRMTFPPGPSAGQ